MKARYINSKQRRFLDPNQRIIESWNCSDGTTKVKALDPKGKSE
jgi:hypothetical protein